MIELKVPRSDKQDSGCIRGDARTARQRFHRIAPPILALCLAGLVFSASAQASGGTAEAWGSNEAGQLGNGTTSTTGCKCIDTPVAVSGLAGATQISGGAYHTLALLSNGTVMAWGDNVEGQLGTGTSITESTTPVPVSGLSNVIAVAAGAEHSLALLSNGTVMAWGDNGDGELGDGKTTGPETCGSSGCSKTPVPVPGLSNVVAIAASYYYSAALLSNGTVMTWGYDEYGELGDGTGAETGCDCIATPQPVPGVSGAMAISAGKYQAAALLQDGTVKDWGYNYYGDLGGGTSTTTSTTGCYCLGPVAVSGLSGAKATAAGGYHGLALLANGSVQAWGYDYYGQVGNGMTNTTGCECIGTPVSVSGLSGSQAIAAGTYHSLALLSNGTALAWGENNHGQLGNGATSESNPSPVPVSGLSGASSVSANDDNSFAVIGPSQALTVSLAGAGTGTVGGPTGILCPSSCGSRYSQGQVEILRAVPAAGSGFAGFSGPCTGTGLCQVTMGTDQTVTATFGPPKGTAVTKATIKKSKSKSKGKAKGKRLASATFSFSAPGAITGYECALIKPKPKHHKNHKPKGHKVARQATLKKQQLPHFVACAAPKVYKNLKPGKYTFEVRALDILGADVTPAITKFKISNPHRP